MGFRYDRRQLLKHIGAASAASLAPTASTLAQDNGMAIPGPYHTPAELDASLAAAGTSAPDRRMLLALAKPAIALRSKAAEDKDIAIGASKIGGAPDLPATLAWPTRQPTATGKAQVHRLRAFDAERPSDDLKREIALKESLASQEAPLTFVLQVDLAECAAEGELDPDIPREGRLLLFYDLIFHAWFGHEKDGTALFQLAHLRESSSQLVRRQPPDMGYPLLGDLVDYRDRLPAARLTPAFTLTLPDGGSAPILTDYTGRGPLPHQKWLEQTPTHLGAANRLGGWPENIQGDMAVELAELDLGTTLPRGNISTFTTAAKAIRPWADQWVHLLQVGDYDNTVNDFDGLYHVWIRRDHLKAREFDKARLIYRTS